ncbi:hypothetical protein BCR32DRAFT_295389 [Anaeromyces robustus]|jgi:actin related protein 2/3 complex subunit 1A/1B|uniref:Actin-related protein 2/3 complex subunit n=1 Tax=Anaeromyces robustus TaxID=1754192 RepID=A0A1Y1WWX3_9FUNG|nr:hypothetical protein BCR32DRAFT_295389 [Anaeromyces robustus]|eukprot:ORX77828.1 hypothetical protein BCR32DRAFT_295389 [Anaeromyces robustus]
MSVANVFQIVKCPITCHSFNKNRSEVAICPNTNEIHIYKNKGGKWELDSVLKEHDKLITSIDWAPETDRIVSCSQDRNAYVWKRVGNGWEPTLVILRINRAATVVKWSPQENKFAVGTGAKNVAVCYYDERNNWWRSIHINKLRSTVLSLDWHPDNLHLAVGTADSKVRVFSTISDEAITSNKKIKSADTLISENKVGGWVHGVAFSPSGNVVAYIGHDSSLSFLYRDTSEVVTVKSKDLPYLSLLFTDERHVITIGYDCCPILFEETSPKNWKNMGKLDQGEKKEEVVSNAFNKFRQMDTRGQENNDDSSLPTTHQNTINDIRMYAGTRDNVTSFTTSGLDGKIVVWEFDLATALSKLKI